MYLSQAKTVGEAGMQLHAPRAMHHRMFPVACCVRVSIQKVVLCTDGRSCQQVRELHPAMGIAVTSLTHALLCLNAARIWL